MKTTHKNKALTLGNLIETVYGAYGNRRAKGMIQLAIDAHVIVFQKQRPVFDLLNRGLIS